MDSAALPTRSVGSRACWITGCILPGTEMLALWPVALFSLLLVALSDPKFGGPLSPASLNVTLGFHGNELSES